MTSHVEHLLAAYVDRQLTRGQSALVYKHISTCAACRVKLGSYERLAFDLQATVGTSWVAPQGKVSWWWQKVLTGERSASLRSSGAGAIAPVLLTVVLLLVPAMAATGSISVRSSLSISRIEGTYAPVQPTESLNAIGAFPLSATPDKYSMSTLTQSPQETVATAAPAPLAPSTKYVDAQQLLH